MLRKNTLLTRFLILFFSVIAYSGIANTFYWVGGIGSWSDARHWSHTSGGASGAGVPSSADDVYFDANSFDYPGLQIIITRTASCHTLQVLRDVNSPILSGGNTAALDIYGSLMIEGPLQNKFAGTINFKSSQQNNIINTGGMQLGNVNFDGTGSWKLYSLLYASSISLNSGELVANGYEIESTTFTVAGYSSKKLDVTNSIFYVEKQMSQQNSGGLNFVSSNSKLYFEHYPVTSLSAMAHSTHHVTTVDSSHYSETNLICSLGDSLGGTKAPCDGTAWVTAIFPGSGGPYSIQWPFGTVVSANGDTAYDLCPPSTSYQVFDSSDFSLSPSVTIPIGAPNHLNISYSTRQPKCAGYCDGWIHFFVAGGTPNYTYNWSNGLAGATAGGPSNYIYDSALCTGNYRIRIHDSKGCYNTLNAIKLLPTNPVKDTITYIPPSCSYSCNGTATSLPSGGHGGPWTYQWNPGGQVTNPAVNLCPGIYNCTVEDDSGCIGNASVTVKAPPVIGVVTTQTNVTCSGACNGRAFAVPSGGVGSFTYLWKPGGQITPIASNLCAGTYTVVVTDKNGCKDSTNVTITQPNPLVVSISTTNNPLQCGGFCNATASPTVIGGTAPYNYSWSGGITSTNPNITALCANKYILTVTDANGCVTKDSVTITQPNPISVTVNSTVDPSCNGSCTGSISTTASGGNSPYTYKWSSGQTTSNINGLCAGTYTLTVTDKKGCVDSSTVVTLTQPPAISVLMTVTRVSCNTSCDGKAFANPSGGTPPYSYQWDNNAVGTIDSITGLCATGGSPDSVKVIDAVGCSVKIYFSVIQPLPLSTSVTANNSSCTLCNGSAKVNVSGGTPPYTYLWNTIPAQTTDSATSLCPGGYTVIVYDADSCKIVQPVTVVPTVKIIITSTATGLSCFGSCNGTASANVTGGTTPYSYLWLPGGQTTATAVGLCAKTYTVQVHDFVGCFNTDSVTFVNPPQITDSMTSTPVSCNGTCVGTASVVKTGGGTPPYKYSWSSGVTSTTTSASNLCAGTYTITITDSNNCVHTDTVTIHQAPPLSPNPTTVPPTCSTSNGSITLHTTGGIGSYTYLWSNAATTSSISGLPAGIYTVTITDSLGCSNSFPIALSNTVGPNLASTPKAATCWASCNGYDSVYVVSGTPPYTFSWSTGKTTSSISNLCPGPYVCAVTDGNGCITNEVDTIKRPTPIKANATVTDVTCNGAANGTISLATTGGNAGGYTYIWAPNVSSASSATHLVPNTYTITITDSKGCDTTVTETITEPSLLTVTMTFTNVTCNGNCDGMGSCVASGGTGPYTYTWSNGAHTIGIVNLCPGFYNVTVTDANGCSIFGGGITITEPAVLTGTMSSTNVSCNGGSNGSATVTVSGGTINYSYEWNGNPFLNTSSITPITAGSWIVVVTDNNGCMFTDSVTVTQPNALNIGITPDSATCNGDCDGIGTPTISGGTLPYTYSWSNSSTKAIDSTLCAGISSLKVTDANGCSLTQTVTINQPTPLLAGGNSTNTSCSGKCDGTATAIPSGGTSPYKFSWSTGATTSSISFLCPGSYTVYVKDAHLCTDSAVVAVNNPTPVSAAIASSASNCSACNGTITLTPSGGTGPYTFMWSPSASTSDSVNNACAGVYSYTVTDSKGCLSSSSIILNSSSGPTGVTITESNDSCFGECDGILIIPPIGGTAPYTYTFNSSPVQTTDTAKALCSGPYTFVVTDASGCKFTDTTSITQPALLTATSVVTGATCVGKCDGTITVTASGGTPGYKYKWSNGLTTSSATNVCVGIDTITITDANKCTFIEIDTIKPVLVVHVAVVSVNPLCYGNCTGSITIDTLTGGTSPYTLSWNTGQTTSSISPLCVGNYTLTVTDAKGCLATDTAVITQPAALQVVFTSSPVSCNDTCNGKLVATTSGGTTPYTYLWNGGETTDSLVNTCPGADTINITDNNGCKFDTSATLFNPPPISVNNIIVNSTCNTTNSGQVTVTVSGGVAPFTYSWSNLATTSIITNLMPGKYILTLTDSTNCVYMDTAIVGADITVIAKPGNDTSVCALNSAILNGSASTGASQYEWFALPRTLVGTTAMVTVTPATTTTYMLVVTDSICRDSAVMTVTVNPLPTISTGGVQTSFVGGTVTLGGSPTSGAGSTYLWRPSAGMNDSALANPVVSPTVTTVYTVTVTSPFGCVSVDTVTINVLPQFIPLGGFSPNGDGINDVWALNGIANFPDALVEIFNRWGERIFHSIGYTTPWGGTYNKEPLPVGTYYYIITLNDPRFPKPFTGPVTIMR